MKPSVRRWSGRAIGLLVTGVGLYVVAPSVVTMFGEWPQLRTVRPLWFVLLIVLEAASWVSLWFLARITLPGVSWSTAGSSQLAGNAAGRVLPLNEIAPALVALANPPAPAGGAP